MTVTDPATDPTVEPPATTTLDQALACDIVSMLLHERFGPNRWMTIGHTWCHRCGCGTTHGRPCWYCEPAEHEADEAAEERRRVLGVSPAGRVGASDGGGKV